MPTNPRAQRTDFSLDVMGRFVCNGLDEALGSAGPGSRPFDLIVLGGGTFGAALAAQLFANDEARVRRVLVLEGGPLLLPDHVQNLPLSGLDVPPPSSIAQLRDAGQDGPARAEVWGLPWHSSTALSRVGVLPERPVAVLRRVGAAAAGRGDADRARDERRLAEQPWPS